MAFKFRYEALMGYRQHKKEKAEIEYSRARMQLKRLKDELLGYQQEMDVSRNELALCLRGKTDSDIIKNYSSYIGALKIWIALKEAEIAAAEKLAEERLENLLSKTKKYKIMEKLKEKDFQKWKNMLNIMEQKQLSEMGVLRHGREFL
ncbi:MAG: flagellar FliJ family protein [Deltaproteobacteria bacterium]|nr:flagellar FliJ family protein [Deltaproteobacteria bacterium]